MTRARVWHSRSGADLELVWHSRSLDTLLCIDTLFYTFGAISTPFLHSRTFDTCSWTLQQRRSCRRARAQALPPDRRRRTLSLSHRRASGKNRRQAGQLEGSVTIVVRGGAAARREEHEAACQDERHLQHTCLHSSTAVKENVLPPLTADLPFKIVLVHNVVAGPAGARDSVVMR